MLQRAVPNLRRPNFPPLRTQTIPELEALVRKLEREERAMFNKVQELERQERDMDRHSDRYPGFREEWASIDYTHRRADHVYLNLTSQIAEVKRELREKTAERERIQRELADAKK